jgi:hypothetical protein
MSKKEIMKSKKEISNINKLPTGEKSKDLHRPDYKMVVKSKIDKTSMLLILVIYTVGVVFVTWHFAKESCS